MSVLSESDIVRWNAENSEKIGPRFSRALRWMAQNEGFVDTIKRHGNSGIEVLGFSNARVRGSWESPGFALWRSWGSPKISKQQAIAMAIAHIKPMTGVENLSEFERLEPNTLAAAIDIGWHGLPVKAQIQRALESKDGKIYGIKPVTHDAYFGDVSNSKRSIGNSQLINGKTSVDDLLTSGVSGKYEPVHVDPKYATVVKKKYELPASDAAERARREQGMQQFDQVMADLDSIIEAHSVAARSYEDRWKQAVGSDDSVDIRRDDWASQVDEKIKERYGV